MRGYHLDTLHSQCNDAESSANVITSAQFSVLLRPSQLKEKEEDPVAAHE